MGRHTDDDLNGVADYAEEHPYGEDDPVDDGVVGARFGGAAGGGLTAETLRDAMGATLSLARYAQLLPSFNSALLQAGCTTVNRAAMFAAQIGHESVGLKYGEEIASGAAYEGRKDLGNTQPGDGKRFKGHGWIQITGRANHTAVSKWAHSKGYVPTPTFFVDNPAALADDKYVWIGPVWYWTVARSKLNSYADAGDLLAATKAINGGTNGLTDRQRRWNTCIKFGTRLLPTASTSSVAATTTRAVHVSKQIDIIYGPVGDNNRRTYRGVANAEANSPAVGNAWITWGSTWGSADIEVVFLDGNGTVIQAPTQSHVPNNCSGAENVPTNSRQVTVAGTCDPDALVSVSVYEHAPN